jgi:hypothetical protein
MAKSTRWTNAVRSLAANAIDQEFDTGYLRIYDGTIPTNAETAIGAQVLLAELRFAADAVASESNGVLTFGTITSDASANASGTASWFRALKSDGTTVIMDGTVGTSDANLILPTVTITATVEVAVSSMTVTVAATSAL